MSSNGRRKSQFLANTVVPAGSTFDFVINGVNYKITDTDLYAALGVTGTMAQAGSVTAVPVLNIQGTVNNIRNLETAADSGLQAAVSPENGITLALNAQSSGDGVAVLSNDNKIRRIKAGVDITVATSGDDIVIGVSGTPGASNVVVVTELGDFPTPVSTVIPLGDDTIYFINTNLDIGVNTFRMGSNTVVTGLSSSVVGLTSSSSAPLFANSDGYGNEVSGVKLTHPNGVIFEITNGGATATLIVSNVTIDSCVSVLTAVDSALTRFVDIWAVLCSADAFVFQGGHALVDFESVRIDAFTGTAFDLGTATFDRFIVNLGQIASPAGANLIIDGALAGANINSGGSGDVARVAVTGSYTDSTTILPDDIGWNFQSNTFIGDSAVHAMLSMQANATATVIAGIGTPVLAAGTWAVDNSSKTTGTTAGRVTYNGSRNATLNILASLTVNPVAGNNRDLVVQIALNGTVIANSARGATVSSSSSSSVTVPWLIDMAPGDYVETFVTNNTSTDNILVSSAALRVG